LLALAETFSTLAEKIVIATGNQEAYREMARKVSDKTLDDIDFFKAQRSLVATNFNKLQ
jgi:hypothetical protein